MTTITTPPSFETEIYPCDEIEDFEIRIYAEPTRPQKRYTLYAEYAPMASGDTRRDLLSAALASIASEVKPAINTTKLMLALCQNDMLCNSGDGCELLNGEDLAPISGDIHNLVWRAHVFAKQLARMAAEGAFTDADEPKQELELPSEVTPEQWEGLGRALRAAGGELLAKQYAQGRQVLARVQGLMTESVEAQLKLMEGGLLLSRRFADVDRCRETLEQIEALTGEPSQLAGRFNELAGAFEATRAVQAPQGAE